MYKRNVPVKFSYFLMRQSLSADRESVIADSQEGSRVPFYQLPLNRLKPPFSVSLYNIPA